MTPVQSPKQALAAGARIVVPHLRDGPAGWRPSSLHGASGRLGQS